MGLVHDNEVPCRLAQAGKDVLSLCKVEGGDNLPFLPPRIRGVLTPEFPSPEYGEVLAELVLQLPLPLKCEVRGRYDQGPFNQTSELELTKQ